MATTEVLSSAEEHMKKAVETLKREFQTVRTGRANPALLDRVEVEYYGSPQSMKNVANITVPDARTLVIAPYEKSLLKEIEKAITNSGLGLTPNSDGAVIRIVIPTLTEERRKDLTKLVRKYAEESRVSIRNIRGGARDDLKKMKGKEVSEDELKRQEENLQKLTDKYVKEVDKLSDLKEAEVMEV